MKTTRFILPDLPAVVSSGDGYYIDSDKKQQPLEGSIIASLCSPLASTKIARDRQLFSTRFTPLSDEWGPFRYAVIDDGPVEPFSGNFARRTLSKNSGFATRKARGEIVIAPYLTEQISYSAERLGMKTVGTVVNALHGLQGFGTPAGGGTYDIGYSGGPVFQATPSVRCHYITLVEGYDPSTFGLTEELMRRHADAILALVKDEYSSALVTSTLADANAGTLDVLTSIAELPETIRYIVDICKRSLELYGEFRRKELDLRKKFKTTRKTTKELLDAISSLWLQWRYAIGPNIMMINDAISSVEAFGREFATYRGRADTVVPTPELHPFWTCISGTEIKIEQRCFIKRSYDVSTMLNKLRDILLTNITVTALELIPLSFVAGWFINVGDVLTALGPSFHQAQGASYSRKYHVNQRFEPTNENWFGTLNFSVAGYERIVIDPSNDITLNLTVDINWKRALDSIALSWQMFLRHKVRY